MIWLIFSKNISALVNNELKLKIMLIDFKKQVTSNFTPMIWITMELFYRWISPN